MLTRLWSFFTGYVSLVVQGKSLEKFINMAVSRGLYLWDVKWIDSDRVSVKVRLNGIRAMRHIARRTRSRFKIADRGGMPFGVARARKRKVLLAGALLCVILIYMMSSFIWFVEVKGNKKVSSERIIGTAEDAGLAQGTLKFGVDKDKVEKYIKNEVSELSWVGVKITGTRAVIEVAEKIIQPPVDTSPADLVAEKAGLVEEILVLNGKPVVKEGDMVKQGDLLITGVLMPEIKPEAEDEASPFIPVEPVRYVRAKGIVRAKVWYEGYGEGRLVDAGTRRTGKEEEVLSLRLFGKQIIFKGPREVPFQDFIKTEDVKTLPEWRNISIPVELVTTNYYEVEKYRDIIGLSAAKSLASDKALIGARSKVPEDAKVIREITEEIAARGSNIIRVKAIIEVMEDIGRAESLQNR